MHKNLHPGKDQIRWLLKQKRAGLSPDMRHEYSRCVIEKILSLPEVDNADSIFAYLSFGSELETHELISALLKSGKQIAIPKIINKEFMIAVAFTGRDKLEKAELGILAPMTSEPLDISFDVIITPGLGFTVSGHRIGYGAGYYDRWFDKNPAGIRIAPAFEVQLVDALPTDKYDRPVHRILTEQRDIVIASNH